MHGVTDLLHHSERLVPDQVPVVRHPAIVKMEIRPADRRRGDTHQHVRTVLDLGVGNVANLDVVDVGQYHASHVRCPF